ASMRGATSERELDRVDGGSLGCAGQPFLMEGFPMRRHAAFVMMGLTLAILSAQPASAGKRQFSLDPYGFRRLNGAFSDIGSFAAGGVGLPSGSGAQVAMGFVIPKPYRSNTNLTISIHWHTADPNCSIELQPDFVDRSRPGHAVTTGN